MRWVTLILVFVATPLVLIAAAAILPVEWLVVASFVFLTVGTVALFIFRRRAPTGPDSPQSTVE
jgi:hypothetical protein